MDICSVATFPHVVVVRGCLMTLFESPDRQQFKAEEILIFHVGKFWPSQASIDPTNLNTGWS